MLLSVVIPTYHRNDLLKLCLQSLSPINQTLDIKYYEVIVTDDGKESTAKKIIADEFPWCRWVQGPQRGPASNRNFGASQVKSNWVVFIDDDCLPDENLLLTYKNAIEENPDIKVFEGCIKADREQKRFDEESPVNLTGGYMWSCNFMVFKKVFNQVGGFDENFPSPAMEDVDLTNTILKNDIEILFLKKAFVIHPWRKLRDISFVKKHHKSFIYYSLKNKEFSKSHSVGMFLKNYLRDCLFIFKNAISFKFRGIFKIILSINYDLILKINYVLLKK